MSDSNRLRITTVKEVTFGTTPSTPRMRTMRVTGESLKYEPQFVSSQEIRSDRMNSDPILTNVTNTGGINFELSYPVTNSPLADVLASGFYSAWVDTNSRDNDGTADSVITGVATTGGVVTVTTGTAFVAGQLVRASGFAVAANNGTFKCTTGSATVPAFVGQSLADESAPPAAARIKVCGFEGAAGDVTATATGLASTSLDFTTLGMAVGQWIKIGGSATANKFATAALNSWARITAIAAHALTLDNLPTGWTTDDGATKTIRVFFGDYLRNGTTRSSLSIERGFMDQTTPTYIVQTGMVVGQLDMNYDTSAVLTASATFSGLGGSQSTTSLGSSPDAATTNVVMSANASVGRISENGATVASPNYVQSFKVSVNNNTRTNGAVGSVGFVDIGAGVCAVTGTMETYFGSNTLYANFIAGTPSNLSAIATKNNQALIVTLPRITYSSGAPSAAGQNQDVMLSLGWMASYDTTTACQIQLDRLEYYEV